MTESALPDYGNLNSGDKDTSEWKPKDIEDHWRKTFVKLFQGSAPLWTIKEKALLKRMMKEYSPAELAEMISYWMEYQELEEASNFTGFYMNRVSTKEGLNQLKDWKWE